MARSETVQQGGLYSGSGSRSGLDHPPRLAPRGYREGSGSRSIYEMPVEV